MKLLQGTNSLFAVLCAILPLLTVPTGLQGESAPPRPNILWITSEDNNVNWIGSYGNPRAETPNIDRLAAGGHRYTQAYADAPVCAPQRSTWITGMLAISNGTFPMRSRNRIPHDEIPYYPDLLRAAGYYTGNDNKTDYNIGGRPDKACWDNPRKVDWEALRANQPFFQVINFFESHESKAQGNIDRTRYDPREVELRAYHPDLPDIRKNYAKYHDAVKRMDGKVGDALAKLESMGLAEDTIVIYSSDHGGVLPRSKRYLFQSGLHCPLIVRIPEKYPQLRPPSEPGAPVDRLVSFVDLPKTWLALAGAEIPETFQGQVFLGPETEPEDPYHFAFRGRMDERLENARSVNDKRYLYIRNYMPYVPWMQHLNYLWKMRATRAWDAHVRSGDASEVEARFFAPKGWTEELYDMRADPDNVENLADDPAHAGVLERMRGALRERQLRHFDSGLLPETEMVRRAAQHDQTIYEMVRDPAIYDLPALLDAADLALEQDPANLSALENLLDSPDSGLRYWGTVGCFLLGHQPAGFRGIDDASHEVRIMAAWLLIRTGGKEAGLACLRELLEEDSYATLTVLNALEWISEEEPEALQLVDSIPDPESLGNYENRMLAHLRSL